MATFLLLKLPFVARRRIIAFMHPFEIIKLSLCSIQMVRFLRAVTYNIIQCFVCVLENNSSIHLKFSNQESAAFGFANNTENGGLLSVAFRDIESWIGFNSINSVQDLIFVANRIRSLFRIERFVWWLFWEALDHSLLIQILSSIVYEKNDTIVVKKGDIDHESLNYLMDKVDSKSRLAVTSSIPSDFRHPNAFKYKSFMYEDAHWVSIDDLLTIRHCGFAFLINTNFNCNDINRFLRFWIDSDEDMVRDLRVNLKNETIMDQDVLRDQLVTLENIMEGVLHSFYIMTKKTNRKYILGHIEVFEDSIEFRTWSKEDEEYLDKMSIIEMMYQKNTMKSQYSECVKNLRTSENASRRKSATTWNKLNMFAENV